VTWAGVRLSELLAECEPRAAARFVWSSGCDHGVFEGDRGDAFVKDLFLDRVGADVLIAYEMLRPEHGFPARLVVPGYYGTNSVKWLGLLTLADARASGPFTTRWYNDPILDVNGPTDRGNRSGRTDRAGVRDRIAGAGQDIGAGRRF